MDKKDRQKFTEIMMGISENVGDPISKHNLELFFNLASEDKFTIDQFEMGAKKLLRTWKYKRLPNYADFYEAINGTPIEKAEKQANIVIECIRKGLNIAFNDPVTRHLMNTRWQIDRLRKTLYEADEKWFIKDFKEAYVAYANTANAIREIEDKTPKQIQDICEQIGN